MLTLSKKQIKKLKNIIISIAIFLLLLIANFILKKIDCFRFENGLGSVFYGDFGWMFPFFLYLALYIFSSREVLRKTFYSIKNGQIFDEDFLMVFASLGAIGLSIYSGINKNICDGISEAVAVIIFYQVGEWFENYAVNNSRRSISELMSIRPDYAYLKDKNGELCKVEPTSLKVGDIIVVRAGEKIAVDGVVVMGCSSIDTSALTGESMPINVNIDSSVLSGSLNLTGRLEIRVEKTYSSSTVSKILELVENASSKKSKSENFIARFAKYYTPIVVLLSVLVAVLPPIINIIIGQGAGFDIWIYRALNFLVVSCPCALVISIPLTFFSAIGGASNCGILIKGGSYLEKMNKVNTYVFDKTGTLTKGKFSILKVYPENEKEKIIKLACICEKTSLHPIAKAICDGYNYNDTNDYTYQEIAGKGIIASGKSKIICGNEKLFKQFNIDFIESNAKETTVYVAENDKFIGYIVVGDSIKESAKDTISYLNKIGKTYMLTGDNIAIAESVAKSLCIDNFSASLLPQNKVEVVKNLIDENGDNVCFVGDGINDAPVLMTSSVGISMGDIGSDATIEASDIVFMRDDISCIKKLKQFAKKTMRIVYQNLVFALFVKFLIMLLSFFGYSNMWLAVMGDVGVAVIAILNAMRARKTK